MKVQELKKILAQCNDDDDVAIRLFPSGFSDVYSVKRYVEPLSVVLLYSYPLLSALTANSVQIAHKPPDVNLS